jgi:hypothetical protein
MVPDGTYRWFTIGHPPEVMGTYGNIGNSSKEMLMKRWRFHGIRYDKMEYPLVN